MKCCFVVSVDSASIVAMTSATRPRRGRSRISSSDSMVVWATCSDGKTFPGGSMRCTDAMNAADMLAYGGGRGGGGAAAPLDKRRGGRMRMITGAWRARPGETERGGEQARD